MCAISNNGTISEFSEEINIPDAKSQPHSRSFSQLMELKRLLLAKTEFFKKNYTLDKKTVILPFPESQ